MNFLIADTFQSSLARLTGAEQKAAKTAAFDLQLDPAGKGKSFHRLDRVRDPNFWSVRVSDDLRLIVHRAPGSLLLAYVGHHDDAYAWAARRRLDAHPTTGAAQIVEVREAVVNEEFANKSPAISTVPSSDTPPLPLAGVSRDDLLAHGVPPDWLDDVLAATEDSLLDIAAHLPAEAAEAVLAFATGARPEPPAPPPAAPDPFAHPDALRRFRVLDSRAALERALDYPWDRWTVFLHPAQSRLVERAFTGPARVAGSAGTGKTVVALHRAAFLARTNPRARLLLTTFTPALASALRVKLRRLVGDDPDQLRRIDVEHLEGVGARLHAERHGPFTPAAPATIRKALTDAMAEVAPGAFTPAFLWAEWESVVDAWGVRDWDHYRDVPRLGRKTRIGGKQRETLWAVFEAARARLDAQGVGTWADLFQRLAQTQTPLYDHIVVDEAQDVSVAELRFLTRLTGERPDALFFAGDLGQRIFRAPFSWKAVGVDVRGRSHTLRVNYRTSHQIRARADRLLPGAVADVDGLEERRAGVTSVFNGPDPDIRVADDPDHETEIVADWLRARIAEGVAPDEIGVFVRTPEALPRAAAALDAAAIPHSAITADAEPPAGRAARATMHIAKGMEFRAVAVMACDEDLLPLAARIEAVADESDLEEVYATERHLLYVAFTRARDSLLVTGVYPASEFLGDLQTDR